MARTHCILGTAGHIDHGKSALVKALTGTDPDRLAEEQSRGMTIVLGFARLDLPVEDNAGIGEGSADRGGSAMQVGIVDVPGHERFIRTMVAGATGIDLGLLVVAADDGIMPQTREHVEILDLLGVTTGLIAITKADLAHDQRIEEVRREIAELLGPTSLRKWPVIATSARSGIGLDEIRSTVRNRVEQLPPRREGSIFRLAIDRVFTIHGRGTVVTGSVLSGRVRAGEALELQPAGLSCKVRGVQSHGSEMDNVAGGQRAALNLTGVDREAIKRGMELATPGFLTRTRYIEGRVRILPRVEKAFESHRHVRVSMGTSETMAVLVVIGADHIEPGGDAPMQLRFAKPIVAAYGQRFILRNESSHATIGGGQVVRPVSSRVRPHHTETIRAVEGAESADAYVRFGEAVRRAGFTRVRSERLACEVGIEPGEVEPLRDRLAGEGLLTTIGACPVHRETLEATCRRVLGYLDRHHRNRPNVPGVSRDRTIGWIEAWTAPGLGRAILEHLIAESLVSANGPYVAHHAFRPALSAEDASLVEQLVEEIAAAEFDPPEWTKLKTVQPLTKPRAKGLVDLAKIEPRLVSFASGRYISASSLDRFKRVVGELGIEGRRFKLADVRDAVGQSRRVVQPLLEHLDRVKFTKRVGDERILL